LAVLEDKAGRWDRSADAYAHAIAITRDDPALLNNAGVSLMRQKRFAEAIRLFQQVLLLDPENERARNNLDIARVAGGERPSFDAEEGSLRRAERLNNAGYAALLAGDDAAASQYFADAIKTNPFAFSTAEANLQDASAHAQATP
jgi:Tfp pilus assembly protein PilF